MRHLRIVPIALVALLTATGCVSVSGAPAPHRPSPSPADGPSLPPAPETPAAREVLASTGPARPSGRSAQQEQGTREKRSVTGAERVEQPVRLPARQAAKTRAPRRATGPARPPRTGLLDFGGRPLPRPRTDYDMGHLCAASAGVADPSLTALCRESYGR